MDIKKGIATGLVPMAMPCSFQVTILCLFGLYFLFRLLFLDLNLFNLA
jgi:hypothetical protein